MGLALSLRRAAGAPRLAQALQPCGILRSAGACAKLNLACRQFDWSEAARQAGLAENAAYLIRPDGHVALAPADQNAPALEDYAARRRLRF